MIRSRIAWTSVLLAGLTGCTSAQHRNQMGVPNRPAAAEAQAEPPATGMARFFPNLTAREAAAKPPAKPASQPAATRALASKAPADPPKAEKKVFAPLARIEARWATRVKNARAAAAQMTAPTPTTTAFMKQGPEPATLPRSIAVAVYPDEPASTTSRPPSNPNPPMSEPPAAEPTAEAEAGPRDDDARRTLAEKSDVEPTPTPSEPSAVAEPAPTPSIAPETPEPPAPETPSIAPETPEPSAPETPSTAPSVAPQPAEANLSQFSAPEPPHLPPTGSAAIPASLAGRPRLASLNVAHRPHVQRPTESPQPPDPPKSVKLPPLGLPAELPPPLFLRSYYGLDPSPRPTPTPPSPAAPAPTPRPAPGSEAVKPSWLERMGMFLAEQTGGR